MTRSASIVFLALIIATPAFAGTFAGGGAASARVVCRDDAVRFCSPVIKDAGKRRACMIAHRSQLSSGCQAVLPY